MRMLHELALAVHGSLVFGHVSTVSFGRVMWIHEDKGIHNSCFAAKGFSGAGLYNFKGELIGIQHQLEGEYSYMAIAVSASKIKKFLESDIIRLSMAKP